MITFDQNYTRLVHFRQIISLTNSLVVQLVK